jgi:LysM repeat protein
VGNALNYSINVRVGTQYTNTYTKTYAKFGGYKEAVITGTSSHSGFLPGTTTNTYDANGFLTRVANGTKVREFINNASGQVLQKRENGQTEYYYYANGNPIGSSGGTAADFDFNYTPVSAQYPATTPSGYTVNNGDTLRGIALAVYGDARLWYLVADANGLRTDADLRAGQTLTIPNQITNVYNSSSTFKVYEPGSIIGDTTPTLPEAPPPPARKGCGVLGQLVMAVVAAVVFYYTGQYIGWANPVVTGAIAGAVASVASQAVGMAIGAQDKFSWKQVGLSAIGGGVTGGLSGGAPVDLPGAIQQAVVGNVINQGIAVVTGLQEKFSWRAVAASAIGAAAAHGFSQSAVGKAILGADMNPVIKGIAYRTVSGIVSGVSRQVVMGGKMQFASIAADAFGNALGNAVVGSMQPRPTQGVGPWSAMGYVNEMDKQDDAYVQRSELYGLAGSGPVKFGAPRGHGAAEWSRSVDKGIAYAAHSGDLNGHDAQSEAWRALNGPGKVGYKRLINQALVAAQQRRWSAQSDAILAQRLAARSAMQGVQSTTNSRAPGVDSIPTSGYGNGPAHVSSPLSDLPSPVREVLRNLQALPGAGGGVRMTGALLKGGSALTSMAKGLYGTAANLINDVRVFGAGTAYAIHAPTVNNAGLVVAEAVLAGDAAAPTILPTRLVQAHRGADIEAELRFGNAGSIGARESAADLIASRTMTREEWYQFSHDLRQKTWEASQTYTGRYRGPVVSGVMDSRTGEFFSGKNELFVPENLHPLLADRATELPSVMNISALREGASAAGVRWPYSTPGAHAEIHAVNQALWAREAAGVPIQLDELYMTNRWLTKSAGPAHRCGYCSFLTGGVTTLTDKR